MSDATKASSKKPKSKLPANWPMLLAAGLCFAFIVGVWANNYRVTQANAAAAAIAAKKERPASIDAKTARRRVALQQAGGGCVDCCAFAGARLKRPGVGS